MGYSYDCAASVLLCAEDNNSILGFDDGDEVETCVEVKRSGVLEERCHLYGEMFLGMPLISDECLELLVKKELDHLPRSDYAERLLSGALDLTIRTDAIDWISKAHAHNNFGPLSAYLAINFLDRFLSAYELPQGKAWMTQLLSIACLALAAKIDESEVPVAFDLQQVGDSKYIFEARTIQRMELLVLNTLKWRLQSVTPFSYVDYFLHKFNDSKTPSTLSVSRSVELILCIMRAIDFLGFRPSEISAAVALSVLSQEQAQKPEIDKVLTCYSHVIKKERVLRCCEMIQAKLSLMNSINNNNNNKNRAFKNASSSASFVPQSPIGVLDAACLSYKSDETTTTTNGIHPNPDHTSPVNKKRRMNRHE